MLRSLILRRLAIGLFTLWFVSAIVFLAVHILPGNAAQLLLARSDELPGTLQNLEKQLGLNLPVPDQYWRWLKGLVTLHWGTSLVSQTPVAFVLKSRAEYSAVLALASTAITIPLATAIGVFSATRSDKASDGVVSVLTLVTSAMPGFVIGILLIFFLAANVFHVLPAASIINPTLPIWGQLSMVVLPVITLVIATLPYPVRFVRASMVDIMQSDYVMMARLKGLPERQVLWRHALRNGVGPIIQAFALHFIQLVGGVVLVETVFSYPGLGLALINSVNARDIPVIQTIVVLLAAFAVLGNLLTDLAVIFVTPRLRARI